LQQSTAKRVALNAYYENAQNLEVFKLTAKAKSSPIDFDIFALTETMNWSLSDRMRFWYADTTGKKSPEPQAIFNVSPGIYLRKLDREEDAFCVCDVNMNGEIELWSNDGNYAEGFFFKVFVNVPPTFYGLDDWEISKQWIQTPEIITMFQGSLDGALGWTERVPSGIDRSIEEAKTNYELKKWNPCVVMCRRALEEIMEFAYRRFFNQEPKGLDFNTIIRKFENERSDVIPKHWINVLDSVRNIGNVPGAHPTKKDYKFTRIDAELSLLQTTAFREAYFSKIDREVDAVYRLEFDIDKPAEEKNSHTAA